MNQTSIPCTPADPCDMHAPCPAHAALATALLDAGVACAYDLTQPAAPLPAAVDDTPPVSPVASDGGRLVSVPCPLGCGRTVATEGGEIHYCVIRAHGETNREYVATIDGAAMFYGRTYSDAQTQLDDYRIDLAEQGLVDTLVLARPAEPAPEPIEVKAPHYNAKIVHLLKSNPYRYYSASMIVRHTSLSFTTVRDHLNRLYDAGLIGRDLDIGLSGHSIRKWYWSADDKPAVHARPAEPAPEFYACSCGQAEYATERAAQREPGQLDLSLPESIAPAPTAAPVTLPVEQPAPATVPVASRHVSAGWSLKDHPDLACIAAQVLLPLAHLDPTINDRGDYLLVRSYTTVAAPASDHQIVTQLIDALNDVARQLPCRPTSIDASMHINGELYTVGHNGPPLRAPQPVCRICAGPHQAAVCPQVKAERLRQTEADAAQPERAAARQYDGAALYEELCLHPRRFFVAFDGWCAQTQASAVRAIAAFWGCEVAVVDADLVERRQALLAEVA